MKNLWFCTDTWQYCKINFDGTYNFIERVWLDIVEVNKNYPDKCYIVKTALIDLNDYTEEEKECNVSGYYDSLESLREIYGEDSNQIIAECIFEEMCDSYASTTEMMTENEANEYIKKYISER